MELPSGFEQRMKELLKDEYEAFLNSYDAGHSQGLRLNLLKTDTEAFLEKADFCLNPIPWAPEGFYYGEADRPGRHPWHEAGVYYMQEPSAMAVVSYLDPKPGECVLDLCAAPGGKTSHIASHMRQQGLLVSNEIHPARAKILSQNAERMGICNIVVTNEETSGLAEHFPLFFDRILVDAPCSGEGMFRKDPEAVRQWSPDNVRMCQKRQSNILENAAAMLNAGGRLVYSTCTFSPEENERTIECFLETHPEFSLEKTVPGDGISKGRPEWSVSGRADLSYTLRIWPHKTDGEGHYIAVLRKQGEYTQTTGASSGLATPGKQPSYIRDKKLLKDYYDFCGAVLAEPEYLLEKKELVLFGEQLYLLPPKMPCFDKLRVLRPGLHLGTLKKNRFEPSHALALSLQPEAVKLSCDFSADSPEAAAYLRGETIGGICGVGWCLVTVDGYCIGWGKVSAGVLKNHYPKGLRK